MIPSYVLMPRCGVWRVEGIGISLFVNFLPSHSTLALVSYWDHAPVSIKLLHVLENRW